MENRLARYQAPRKSKVLASVLKPADASRSVFEVAWDVLSRQAFPLEVTDAAELAERMTRSEAFGAAQAAGWVAGVLTASFAYPPAKDELPDAKLCALDDDVVAALGADSVWHANADGHPLPVFNESGRGFGWSSITRATFDVVVVARGSGLDLVLASFDED
ncbi:hypothetical protein KGQ19_24335 [Catenulispora sp. NL8]|uniref:Uncharacterized protein n=1 Tax=Catenulispora pinistramenti TaxID=2705254 RepID=A0ABS5KVC0_9ACTN|nr:hypothetical protein [Catenulispora pinistramenti]MBS2549997.1 hypothetical protein [Catenulispora pinistramenti]